MNRALITRLRQKSQRYPLNSILYFSRMKSCFILAFIVFIATKVACQDNERLINELNAIIRPIATVNPEDGFEDLEFLKEMTREATVIGIGESTHGTDIYDKYRRRIIRFLIQQMDYKAIVDEGDILAAEKVDAYINGQMDSLDMLGGLRPVIANRTELEWLRLYNESRPEKERVHIYGAEVRGFYGVIQKLKSLYPFKNVDPVLDKFTGDVGVGYKNLSKQDFKDVEKAAEEMKADCNTSSCRYYLSLLSQQIDFAYRQRFGKDDFNVRDQYMFEHINFIISKTFDNKVIVLAHNGHLQKTKFSGFSSMGCLLNNLYKRKYFVIGTDFNMGRVNTYNLKTGQYENAFFNEVEDRKAIEYYFKQCRYSNFLLPVSNAMTNTVTAPLVGGKIKMLRNIGATGRIITSSLRLSENYDLIAFFNDTKDK